MVNSVHPPEYFRDSRRLNHREEAIPAWTTTQHGPLNKDGSRRLAFIWPRDKGRTNKPPCSWRRWKDVFTNKGPGIFVGREGNLEPHRPVWSNWMDVDENGYTYDNLGYLDERDVIDFAGGSHKKYDFRTRQYARPHGEMWSDVKWEKRRHPRTEHYCRDAYGVESFPYYDNGGYEVVNPFAYDEDTAFMDWGRPKPDSFYFQTYDRTAPLPRW
ncbi:hypothetical protein MMC17_006515 [Xylographa soralifera]|nr:hypothetical protein [Xylographa soralifera]